MAQMASASSPAPAAVGSFGWFRVSGVEGCSGSGFRFFGLGTRVQALF